MKKKYLAVGAVALIALTGCGGVEKDASYENVDDLREAVISSEGECPGETAEGENGEGEVLIVCSDDTVLRWFPNEDELTTGKLALAVGIVPVDAFLTGPNWIVQGKTEDLSALQDSLGGELTVK